MTKNQLTRIFRGAGYNSVNQAQIEELHSFIMETRETVAGYDNFITLDQNNLIKVKKFAPKAENGILPDFKVEGNVITLGRPFVCNRDVQFRKPKIGDEVFLLNAEGEKVNGFNYTITGVRGNTITVDSDIDTSKITANRRLSFGHYVGSLLPDSTAFLASYTARTSNPYDLYIDGKAIISIIFKTKLFL